MATYIFDFGVYMNPDGSLVSLYKADYENSMRFIVYENGFKIPAWLLEDGNPNEAQ